MADYNLSFSSVSIPANSGGISVTVEEDSNSDGTTDTTETIALSDGVTDYTTSSGAFAGPGQVALSVDVGPPTDVTVTASGLLPVDVSLYGVSPDSPVTVTAQTLMLGGLGRVDFCWCGKRCDNNNPNFRRRGCVCVPWYMFRRIRQR